MGKHLPLHALQRVVHRLRVATDEIADRFVASPFQVIRQDLGLERRKRRAQAREQAPELVGRDDARRRVVNGRPRERVAERAFGIEILPGYIETPMTASVRADEGRVRRLVAGIPLGRLGTPLDIANTALFLASDESSFFTGEIIFPDGGFFTG